MSNSSDDETHQKRHRRVLTSMPIDSSANQQSRSREDITTAHYIKPAHGFRNEEEDKLRMEDVSLTDVSDTR